jgi:hypothetical protein
MLALVVLAFSLLYRTGVYAQTYSATYLPSNAPYQSENGQTGTNQCGTGSNQTSMCQNAYCQYFYSLSPPRVMTFLPLPVNSVNDFCLFAPPDPGPQSDIGNTEVPILFFAPTHS